MGPEHAVIRPDGAAERPLPAGAPEARSESAPPWAYSQGVGFTGQNHPSPRQVAARGNDGRGFNGCRRALAPARLRDPAGVGAPRSRRDPRLEGAAALGPAEQPAAAVGGDRPVALSSGAPDAP